VLSAAIGIQQIPAPTFAESRRAEALRDRFQIAGLVDVTIDDAGNAYARRPASPGSGQTPRLPVVVSAHMDTVFPAGTDLTLCCEADPVRLFGPGIGDNALGVASLLGLAWALDALGTQLPGDLWLAANTGEEGLGDLSGMRAVVERFGPDVSAYLVVEGMALGHVYHQGIAVRRYRITARAEGGHSWLHFGRPSAVHALVRLAARLADLTVPASPKTTFNIGVITGGTSVNTIAAEASLQLDLRSEDPAVLAALVERVEALARAGSTAGVDIGLEVIGDRPAGGLPPDHPLVQLAVDTLTACGLRRESVTLEAGSTDANVPLSRGLPSVCIGITRGGNAHRPDEYIEIEPIKTGLKQLLALVEGAFGL
jgi:acetylornithine deacetylase/succinyl-diaminopimelate desuccinylase-like protein